MIWMKVSTYGEWVVESTEYFNSQSSNGINKHIILIPYLIPKKLRIILQNVSVYSVLTVVRGLLYSFNNIQSNKAIGSVYQNGTLQELKSTTLAPGNHWPVFATPYFVRT